MDLKQLTAKAIEIKELYTKLNIKNCNKPWGASEYMQGLVGDVGDLSKLIMAKGNYRYIDAVDEKITHELSDCLWAILVIANELKVDIGHEFLSSMDKLRDQISQKQ